MRELPEPDISTASPLQRRIIAYTPEKVLAIQKQAYEDGLRDAALKTWSPMTCPFVSTRHRID